MSTYNRWRRLSLVECSVWVELVAVEVRREYGAHLCGFNTGTFHSEGAR